MTPASVAVVDIGSNSIKMLLASRAPGGRINAGMMRTIEARISAGISAGSPRLGEPGMARALAAVQSLLADAAASAPDRVILAATSAVRDAANGPAFCARVRDVTGHAVRILTGREEADLIGRGLRCDPLLAHLRDFQVFDLGGGSLECLAFAGRAMIQAASLPLGCVRLTEKFVVDPGRPFSPAAAAAVAAHVRGELSRAGVAPGAAGTVVGTGGTLTTLRQVLAPRTDAPVDQTEARITAAQIRGTLERVGALSLAERKKVPGLTPERADVFPVALATLAALAEIGGFEAYLHSLYNLRWGLAAEALGG